MTGVAGYIAPRHLQAIKDTGHRVALALDPTDSSAILTDYFPHARYFNSQAEFERSLKRNGDRNGSAIEYVSICSPTHFHEAQIRAALECGTHAICEKPIVVNPADLARLAEIEGQSGRRIFTILQLRSHNALQALRKELIKAPTRERKSVTATYITGRGPAYRRSWKSDEEKSGGLAMNIGVHLFDLLMWLFGKVERSQLHLATARRMAGELELAYANVQWYLSIDSADLPASSKAANERVFRSLIVDETEFNFTNGLDGLHTRAYESILDGRGPGVEDTRPSIELVHSIRNATISNGNGKRHPMLRN